MTKPLSRGKIGAISPARPFRENRRTGASKEENLKQMKQRLEGLVGVVPQLVSAEVGIDFKHTEMSYDAVLVSKFRSEEDLAAYKVHPAHVEISNFCKSCRESRVVCDYWE